MSMQLVSETLIKREIKRLEDNTKLLETDADRMWLHMCKKELVVIEHLKINRIDMIGNANDFSERIAKQAVYFMEPHEFEAMEEKARRYDAIAGILISE